MPPPTLYKGSPDGEPQNPRAFSSRDVHSVPATQKRCCHCTQTVFCAPQIFVFKLQLDCCVSFLFVLPSSWRFSQIVVCLLGPHSSDRWQKLCFYGKACLSRGMGTSHNNFDVFSSSPPQVRGFWNLSPDMAFSNHKPHSWSINLTLLSIQDRELFGSVYFFPTGQCPLDCYD